MCIKENKLLKKTENNKDSLLRSYNGETVYHSKKNNPNSIVEELMRRKRKKRLKIMNSQTHKVIHEVAALDESPVKPLKIKVKRKAPPKKGMWTNVVKEIETSPKKETTKKYPIRTQLKTEGLSVADFGKSNSTDFLLKEGLVRGLSKDAIQSKEKIIANRLRERLNLNSSSGMTKSELPVDIGIEEYNEEGVEFKFI